MTLLQAALVGALVLACSANETDTTLAREMRLRAIRSHILDSLGMRTLPNITADDPSDLPPIHKLLQYYPSMQADGLPIPPSANTGDGGSVKFRKMFSFPKAAVDPVLADMGVLQFSAHLSERAVKRADLWVGLDLRGASLPAFVVVYTARRSPQSSQHYFLHKEVVKEVRYNSSQWTVLDVKTLVSEWSRQPDVPLNVAIHTYDSSGTVVPFLNDSKALFLELGLEGGPKRSRRAIGLTCEEASSEVRCCRYPLTVDFEEFGWDWIIAPKRYEANYCSGECPYVFLQKYPHTHLVQQASPAGSAGPCCAPRKLSPISMLYFDEDHNIMYGMLPGMIVDRCGCA